MNRTTEKIAICTKSHKLLQKLLSENPELADILRNSTDYSDCNKKIKKWVLAITSEHSWVKNYQKGITKGGKAFERLTWSDYAAIRILDYIDNAEQEFVDQNDYNIVVVSNPFKLLWLAVKNGTGGGTLDYFTDMLELFRQFSKRSKRDIPSKRMIEEWMKHHPSGLEQRIIDLRHENKDRIIKYIVDWIDAGKKDSKYFFEIGLSKRQKYEQVSKWWNESLFHLRFAARDPETLNGMLGDSLDSETLDLLHKAREIGIPFFVNPYYISMLNVSEPSFAVGSDLAIRDYVLYSKELIEQFGKIKAWEKEDIIEEGKPNAAGWLLPPGGNVHRRYPDSAILIPSTKGRACGGLCTPCQRMYHFQKGQLNFDIEQLAPKKGWKSKLNDLMDYFRHDSHLRDILVTGGDALMSTDTSLERILNAILQMAKDKIQDNKKCKDGKKYALMQRVRLGTRLLSYIPQRVTPQLCEILKKFREEALPVGISQFVIQAHFESAMEITPEVKKAVSILQDAGWRVVNQHVFTVSSSRRGHVAKLRKVLCNIGVLPYYTFSVKGFRENHHLLATTARAMQEAVEEKYVGILDSKATKRICAIENKPEQADLILKEEMSQSNIPFVSTDRNIMNLPGVGKSLTYRVVGITRDGRRILRFEHDSSRAHSPIIEKMRFISYVESKSLTEYLRQLDKMGEDIMEYSSIYGYSLSVTEPRFKLFSYPEFDFELNPRLTNLKIY